MILFEKFGQHQPLNRQSERYGREGIDLSVSTLADQVGAATTALAPLDALIVRHVMAAERLHADDTTVPILAKGRTETGRIWTYVRDDRPFGGADPPATLYFASRDRGQEHPDAHLAGWQGLLQADAYAGYNGLYDPTRKAGPVTCALSRTRFAALLADQSACVVATEACATSHHWGGVAQKNGHEVRLVPAVYVKPFIKRQKNDRADAEAIAETALRPTMRFVAVKSAETQGRAVAFRTHQCLVRQRTQLINALRGHLAEFGVVAPKGPANIKMREQALADETGDLPDAVRAMGAVYLDQIVRLTDVIEQLADELETASRADTGLRRLCTIPGIGPVTAGAVAAFAPDLDTFDSGRSFAAWLGLVPRQRSTGGKAKLGSVSKMGQTDIRRLLIVGAMSVIRWVVRKGGSENRWLASLVARKPRMVAAVALANKMARMIWAVTTRQEDYRMA